MAEHMTERERFTRTLNREPIGGRVPTFELVFFLTMEELGKVHPCHRYYGQWKQMSAHERALQINDMADLFIQTARHYHHSAIFIHANPWGVDTLVEVAARIRELTGNEYYLLTDIDPTFPMPNGSDMEAFTQQMFEEPEVLKDEAKRRLENRLDIAYQLDKRGHLLDGFALCSDYCFNVNPFFTRDMMSEFICPYLSDMISGCHDMGYQLIKHTDGNIMPIIDMLVECGPDALHSLDPQGGVDLGEVSRDWGDKVALIGNVNCGLLQTGTEEECIADVRRSLRQGMARGGGYVFATSNCVYTGLDLERYRLMNRIWREEGIYPEQ